MKAYASTKHAKNSRPRPSSVWPRAGSSLASRFVSSMARRPAAAGAIKTELEYRREICAAGRWLLERGYVGTTDGNLSVRLDAQRILITPTGVSKGAMHPADLVVVDGDGRRLSGERMPSSEIAMHLLIYRRRPDVHAVCHAHPPAATGYAAAGVALDKPLLCEVVTTLGTIPLAPFATPGTHELPDALEPFVERHDSILMANHGVVTCGPDLLTASYRMETTEHFARISLVTEILGRQALLSTEQVNRLLAARDTKSALRAPSVPVLSWPRR